MAIPLWTRTVVVGGLGLLLFVCGCAARGADVAPAIQGPNPVGHMKRVPGWWRTPAFADDLSLESLLVAGRASLEYYERQPAGKTFRFGRDEYSVEDLKRFLADFLAFSEQVHDAGLRRDYLKKNARVYRGGGKGREMLFTGYFEPVLEGSRLPGIRYTVPIFGVPGDMITVDLEAFDPQWKGRRLVGRYLEGTLVPYYTRREIDRLQVLSGKGYEIAWVRDPVEAFFLHVQGSGKILLPDGALLNVQYAGNNGRPYRSIGRFLAEQEMIALEDITARKIINYLRETVEEAETVMDYNERYVFFAEKMTGPMGSLAVLLTPERSMATDPNAYPRGALAYVETEVPSVGGDGVSTVWKPAARFVFNQDEGNGVTGPGRGDLFFGTGPRAGELAGEMKRAGKIYFLAPKKTD